MTTVLVDIKFGKWDVLLTQQKPAEKQVYATILYHFGRGMALANKNQTAAAKEELMHINVLLKDSVLQLPFSPFSPAVDGAMVAANLLDGSIALKEKKYASAIELFSKASSIEEQMVYNEPRDWLLNPKQYLGNAHLENKQWADAETTFRRDLKNNNDNIWALMGLYTSLLKQKKLKEAEQLLIKIKPVGARTDVKINTAVF